MNQSCNMKTDIKLLNKKDFIKNINGKEIGLYVLKNKNGLISPFRRSIIFLYIEFNKVKEPYRSLDVKLKMFLQNQGVG